MNINVVLTVTVYCHEVHFNMILMFVFHYVNSIKCVNKYLSFIEIESITLRYLMVKREDIGHSPFYL